MEASRGFESLPARQSFADTVPRVGTGVCIAPSIALHFCFVAMRYSFEALPAFCRSLGVPSLGREIEPARELKHSLSIPALPVAVTLFSVGASAPLDHRVHDDKRGTGGCYSTSAKNDI